MLAEIEKSESVYIAIFNRHLHHTVEDVWTVLMEKDKLEKWFSNLQVTDLQKGGTIKFNMNDGSGNYIDMKITDFEKFSVLEYEWGEGRVRFELSPQSEGCLLVLKEFIPTLTEHTAKDLSGWHICLDVLKPLLNGIIMEFPMDEWEKVYGKYKDLIDQIIY